MQLSRILFSVALTSLLSTAGCTLDGVSSRSDAIQSCYDTGHGIKCVNTPGSVQTALADVDGDGQEDTFLCGNGISESDSDIDGADSDTSSEEDAATGEGDVVTIAETGSGEDGTDEVTNDDLDVDSESDSESASESDDPCAASDDASDDDSESDAEGDGDADGVADVNDCDCIAQTDPIVIQ